MPEIPRFASPSFFPLRFSTPLWKPMLGIEEQIFSATAMYSQSRASLPFPAFPVHRVAARWTNIFCILLAIGWFFLPLLLSILLSHATWLQYTCGQKDGPYVAWNYRWSRKMGSHNLWQALFYNLNSSCQNISMHPVFFIQPDTHSEWGIGGGQRWIRNLAVTIA